MPRSRRQLRKTKKLKKTKTKKNIKRFFALFVLLVIAFLFCFLWKLSSVEKFTFVKKLNDGGAEVILFLPEKEKLLVLEVPATTQLDLSQNLGIYKLESAWKLSEKESMEGGLIAKTFVKNFSLPVYYWKDESSNNLGFFRNLKIMLVEKNLLNFSEERYDLSKTPVLDSLKLKDGSEGYKISGSVPSYILVNFSKEFESPPKAQLIDYSGDFSISDKLSSILSNMGVKVSSYTKNEPFDGGCSVSGQNSDLVSSISKVLGCQITQNSGSESDIVIEIKKDFAKNF